MTVSELIKRLQTLESEGRGNLPVLYFSDEQGGAYYEVSEAAFHEREADPKAAIKLPDRVTLDGDLHESMGGGRDE